MSGISNGAIEKFIDEDNNDVKKYLWSISV